MILPSRMFPGVGEANGPPLSYLTYKSIYRMLIDLGKRVVGTKAAKICKVVVAAATYRFNSSKSNI